VSLRSKLLNGNLAGKEDKVISKTFWRGVLIVALSVALAKPAEAEGYPSGGATVAAIVGVVAAVVVVAVLVIQTNLPKSEQLLDVSTRGRTV
jgi:hypothetical protein